VFKPPKEYKTIEYRECRCHIPKTFVRRAGEGSSIYECKLDRGMQVFIEVGESIPVENIVKMPESQRELSELTENLAFK